MLKKPVIFHQRLCIHITIVVLISACFLALGAAIIFNYMCHKIIAERSEKAFIYLQQQNLIDYALPHMNPAAKPVSLKTIVKTKNATTKKKAIKKTSKRKKTKTANKSNAKSPTLETTTVFFKALGVFKYFSSIF